MTTNQTTPVILNAEQVAEIEAANQGCRYPYVDALCATVRAQASLIEDFRHNRIGDELQRVAEGMRERCVARVKEMLGRVSLPSDDPFNNGVAGAYSAVVTVLESIPLEAAANPKKDEPPNA